eukprot:3141394-Amphidinium_carterae.1
MGWAVENDMQIHYFTFVLCLQSLHIAGQLTESERSLTSVLADVYMLPATEQSILAGECRVAETRCLAVRL